MHSILCTAPDEDHFEINWGTGDGGFFENEGTFTVGDEEPATNGTKGRKVMFTALPEVNGTTLKCVVINFDQPSDSLNHWSSPSSSKVLRAVNNIIAILTY